MKKAEKKSLQYSQASGAASCGVSYELELRRPASAEPLSVRTAARGKEKEEKNMARRAGREAAKLRIPPGGACFTAASNHAVRRRAIVDGPR